MNNATAEPKIHLETFRLSPPDPAERNLDTIIPYAATGQDLDAMKAARRRALRRQDEPLAPRP